MLRGWNEEESGKKLVGLNKNNVCVCVPGTRIWAKVSQGLWPQTFQWGESWTTDKPHDLNWKLLRIMSHPKHRQTLLPVSAFWLSLVCIDYADIHREC